MTKVKTVVLYLSFYSFTGTTSSAGYEFDKGMVYHAKVRLSDGGLMCSFMGGLMSSTEREPDSHLQLTGFGQR